MVWYLLNIAIITLAYLWPSRQVVLELGYDISVAKRKRVCIAGSITWILLSGLRHLSVGPDTATYKTMFERVFHLSWKTLIDNFDDGYFGDVEILRDPGYPMFEKLFQYFSKDYQVFLVFIATLFFVALGIFLFKFSRNPYLSYLLYSTLFYSFYTTTAIRQTIATTFVVLLGMFLIKKRKFIPFLIIVLLSSTIHLSCLCFLPFYFIARIPINKATMSMYWIAIASSFFLRYELLDILKSIVGYEQYNDYEGAGAGIFMYLILAVALVVTIFQKKLLDSNPKVMQITINALMVACFFLPLALINQSCMRVVHYYALFLMILLPELSQLFAKESDKKIYNLFAIGLLVVLFVLNEPTYKFFWQN